MDFKSIGRVAASAALVSLLGACGGGGGGGSSSATQTAQTQSVVITQSNATPVAAEALDAADAGSGASASVTGVQVSAASVPSSAMTAIVDAVRLGLQTTAPQAVVGATTTVTSQCSGGGSINETITRASSTTVTAGDSVAMSFNSCVEAGTTVTGSLSVAVVSVNTAHTLIVVDITASAFTATSGGLTERLSGQIRVTLDDTRSTDSVVTITGSSLSFDRLVNGTARATRTLSNYSFARDTTIATGSTSQTFSFTASGSFPSFGTVSFDAQTTQPIVTPGGALYPASGTAKVTGANGSSVTVTVISTGVRLDIDTNGDGVADQTITRTWAELSAQP